MHTDAELIAFFDRHQGTVDSVTLRSVFLHQKDSGSTYHSRCEAWKHFFGQLRNRSINFQSLYAARIHDFYNCVGYYPDNAVRVNGGEGLLRYLRDGGPKPSRVRAGQLRQRVMIGKTAPAPFPYKPFPYDKMGETA